MASITLRSVKGSPLTNAEVDANFQNLNTELGAKLESITSAMVTTALGYTPLNRAGDTSAGLIEFLDTHFALEDATDPTKRAVFALSGITTGTTRTYTLPNISATIAVTGAQTQTFSGNTTFSSNSVVVGSSTSTATYGLGSGATLSGSTKTVNVGTAGVSGSTTNINIGSAVSGATTSVTANGNWSFANTITGSISGNAATVTSITSSQVTTALGFTPYNSANPSGYITSSALSSYLPLSGGTLTGSLTVPAVLTIQKQNTTGEGGELVLQRSDSSTLSGDPRIDVLNQNIRFFEGGGTFRGVNLDLTGCAAGVGSTLLHSTNYSSYALPLSGGTLSGDLTLSGTGRRISADLSNATLSNRLFFQTSTANSNSTVSVMPSGTGTIGQFSTYSSSDPANASVGSLQTGGGYVTITSGSSGTGSALPVRINIGASQMLTLDTSGNLGLGVIPSAWSGQVPKAIEVSGGGYLSFNTNGTPYLGANVYYNGTTWIYRATGAASLVSFDSVGGSTWYKANSGTAGTQANLIQLLALDTSGNLTATANVTAYSDERLKTDWKDLPTNFVEQLAGVKNGNYKRIDTGEIQVGVSAQSLMKLLPAAVMVHEGGTLSVAYGNAALAACVELAKRIVKLEAELELLRG